MREFLFGLLLFGLVGCSETLTKLELYPVSGRVVRNGQPVRGGGLILQPVEITKEVYTINASVGADGKFVAETLRTLRSGKSISEAGAPVGKYKATYHPASDGAKMGLETEVPEVVTIQAQENVLELILPDITPKGRGEQRDDNLPGKD